MRKLVNKLTAACNARTSNYVITPVYSNHPRLDGKENNDEKLEIKEKEAKQIAKSMGMQRREKYLFSECTFQTLDFLYGRVRKLFEFSSESQNNKK